MIASVAISEGAVSEQFFAVVVGMSVLTTLVASPALRALVARRAQS